MPPTTRKNSVLMAGDNTVADEVIESNDKCDEKIILLLKELDQKIDKNHGDIGAKIDHQALKHSEDMSKIINELEPKMGAKLHNVSSSHSLRIDEMASVMENTEIRHDFKRGSLIQGHLEVN